MMEELLLWSYVGSISYGEHPRSLVATDGRMCVEARN